MFKKGLFIAIVGVALIGVILGLLVPPALTAKQRPVSLLETVADWGGTTGALASNPTPQDVVGMMISSHGRWNNLHAIVDVEFDTGPNVTEEVWLDKNNRAHVEVTNPETNTFTRIIVSDGEQYTIYNPVTGNYYTGEVDNGSPHPPVSPPDGAVNFPHPLTRIIPARSISFLIPASIGQTLANSFGNGLAVLGSERVGNRDTVVLDAQLVHNGQAGKRWRFWVDRQRGTVVKAQLFSGDAETPYTQATARDIAFDTTLPTDIFSLDLPDDAVRVDSPPAALGW